MNIYLSSFLLFTLFYEYLYNKYVFNSLVFLFILYTYYIIQELCNKINNIGIDIELHNKIFEEKIIDKVSEILEQEILEKNKLNEDLITIVERNTILIHELKSKINNFDK
jgi:hypothetical protein